MKTQGEMEAAIGDGIRRFEQECMGRVPAFPGNKEEIAE